MKLADTFHCPVCRGRLNAISADLLSCVLCERQVRVGGGIADFVGDADFVGNSGAAGFGADRYRGGPRPARAGSGELFSRIEAAAGQRWPASLGDTFEFGCGGGETALAIAGGGRFRSLLVVDTDIEMLRSCRSRVADLGVSADRPIAYATLSGGQDAIRDAVADTIIGTGLLSGIGDVRAFLAMVYRVLRPNGRAVFVVPNRRYYEAMSLAMSEALVQRHARDGAWPEGQHPALEFLAHTRRLLVHRGNQGFLAGLDIKHLFDSDALEDLGREIGFNTAEMIPLDPDPAGAETTRRICHDAGAPDSFTETFGVLAAAVGQQYFDLLSRQDQSAAMLLWLTKGAGPAVRIFTGRPPMPSVHVAPDAALGGVAPRWSIELLARDTPDGIVVTVGGWCLCNSNVLWLRLTLDEVTRHAPVWRPRPDVHEVLNRNGVYHPLNTLCSGMASELLFENVHATGSLRPFRFDIALTSGLVMAGPSPEMLVMDEQMVIAH